MWSIVINRDRKILSPSWWMVKRHLIAFSIHFWILKCSAKSALGKRGVLMEHLWEDNSKERSVKVKGQWFLARAEPQNHLRVDRALLKNVHAWAPPSEILNSVAWGPNHVFQRLPRWFPCSPIIENHYTNTLSFRSRNETRVPTTSVTFQHSSGGLSGCNKKRKKKCMINTMKEPNKIVNICYRCHCLPRKSKGTNSMY